MKLIVFIHIAFRIVLLFGSGMLMSYINPELRDFLGDTECAPTISQWTKEYHYACGCTVIDNKYEWHGPHYWYFWGCIFIFILSLINTILNIGNVIIKYYNIKIE